MAGIKDYSTTAANTTSVGGVSIAEGMLPSNINNALRAMTADIREWYNDSQWVIYGDGDGSFTAAYVDGTNFSITGSDVTSFYHVGRRIKAVGSATGTIVGTITTSTFSTDTTVTVSWDSGSLSNESLTIYVGVLSKTNDSIPTDVIATENLKDNAVTTAKITDASVTSAKLASTIDLSSTTLTLPDNSVTTSKIANSNVTTVKIADSNITTAKIADSNVTTAKIADANVTNAKLATNAVTTAKITDANITTAKIADSNVTTAKIADDAVTADKIADAVIVTNAEHSAHTPSDTTFFTTSASDSRYFRQDSSETISSGDIWSASDSYIATTAAIDSRVIDLVDDVGGFVPIANETSFPTANPDINDGAGTIISVTTIGTSRTPSSGTVTIANGSGANTVTITGCGSTVLAAGYGLLVETTTTLHTYTFVRLVPKATEVTTVASISSDISTVAGEISPTNNISSVAGNAANINTVAGISANVTAVAAIDSDVTAVAGDATDIGTVATDLAGSNNIGTVAGSIANVNTTAGSISNVNTVATDITNVNSVATNISGVNSFAERYRVESSDPSTSLDAGDLAFNTSANQLKYYDGSSWNAVAAQDVNVKVSSNDSTSGFLNGKLVAGSGITFTENNDGSNETLTIAAVGETKPTISSISPDTITNAATSIVITGTNYVITPNVEIINSTGGITYPNSITRDSSTQLTINVTLPTDGNYFIRIENPDGLAVRSSTALLTVSDAPTWSTAAGSLGSIAAGSSVSLSVSGSSDSTVAYSETTSVLTSNTDTPASTMNLSLNSSTGAITGTAPEPTAETTYNFTLRLTDAESQTTDRAFSITVTVGINNGGQFN